MSDRGSVLRVHHLLPRNAGIEFSDESSKRLKIQGWGESTSINMGYNWDSAKSMHEVMEALYNYASIVWMYRAFDYSAQAILRACHDIRHFSNVVEASKASEKQQLCRMQQLAPPDWPPSPTRRS